MDNTLPRLLWIDVIRGLAIFLVVFGHLGNQINDFFVLTSPVKMPLFFAISGFLFTNKSGTKIKHLFTRLAVPYCILTLMPIYLINELIKGNAVSYILHFLFGWFIPTFFFTSILFRLQVVYLKKIEYIIPISLIVSIIGFYLPQTDWMKICCFRTILISQLFMVLGFYWKTHVNDKFEINKRYFFANFLIYASLIFITYIYYANESIDVHLSEYYNPVICSILILSGMYLVYEFVRWLETEFIDFKIVRYFLTIFSYIGKYAIVIFLLHGLIANFISLTLGNFYPIDRTDWLNSIVYTILIVFVSTIIGILLDKYCPIVLGNFNKNK